MKVLPCPDSFSQDLVQVHKRLVEEVKDSVTLSGAKNLYNVFINYKEK